MLNLYPLYRHAQTLIDNDLLSDFKDFLRHTSKAYYRYLYDDDGNTLLHYAVNSQKIDFVQALLSNHHPLDLRNDESEMPLLLAIRAESPNFPIIETLLENGASVNTRTVDETVVNDEDVENITLLEAAVATGNVEVVKLFVKYGAKINIKNAESELPIQEAAINGKADIVRQLILAGTWTHQISLEHITDEACIKLLLAAGANYDSLDLTKIESGTRDRVNQFYKKLYRDIQNIDRGCLSANQAQSMLSTGVIIRLHSTTQGIPTPLHVSRLLSDLLLYRSAFYYDLNPLYIGEDLVYLMQKKYLSGMTLNNLIEGKYAHEMFAKRVCRLGKNYTNRPSKNQCLLGNIQKKHRVQKNKQLPLRMEYMLQLPQEIKNMIYTEVSKDFGSEIFSAIFRDAHKSEVISSCDNPRKYTLFFEKRFEEDYLEVPPLTAPTARI